MLRKLLVWLLFSDQLSANSLVTVRYSDIRSMQELQELWQSWL